MALPVEHAPMRAASRLISTLGAVFLTCALHAAPVLQPPRTFTLPEGAIPLKHTVELTIDPAKDTLEGWMRIQVELTKPTAIVWVNARDITPRETVVAVNGRILPALATPLGGEFLAIQTGESVGPGAATLSIRYRGHLSDKALLGPYRRKVEGEWYVYTTFTPIEARRAFPCFDEPHFKTPWEISIRLPRIDTAFSNAKQVEEADEPGGLKLVRFAPTELLPAELVAFAVGPFDVYPARDYHSVIGGRDIPIRVVTAKGHASEARAAVDASATVLPRLEAYTGIAYPFPKLDHVALPEEQFTAVENAGMITYRAKSLLLEPSAETPANLRALRSLEAHEIGHHWFGDFVTQADWDDTWLSEGFATFISEKVLDQEIPPERRHLEAIAARERIMNFDNSSRTRPVRRPAASREASSGIYHRVIYDKGAAVLNMLEGWLGEDAFRAGVRDYLTRHRFANATADDLAGALRAASGTDPSAVMHAFLDKTGVPAVRGDVRCTRDRVTLHLEQIRPSVIPVCWSTDSAHKDCTVLDAASRDVNLASCPAWFYLNAGGTGYYRTAWNAEQIAALPLDSLMPAERLTLVFDLRAQKNDRAATHAELLKLTSDPEPAVMRAAQAALEAEKSPAQK
jgi:alanyl aminopeptidase